MIFFALLCPVLEEKLFLLHDQEAVKQEPITELQIHGSSRQSQAPRTHWREGRGQRRRLRQGPNILQKLRQGPNILHKPRQAPNILQILLLPINRVAALG